jgi:hypothetical protein
VDGTVQRPDWRAGYFVVSEYVTGIVWNYYVVYAMEDFLIWFEM